MVVIIWYIIYIKKQEKNKFSIGREKEELRGQSFSYSITPFFQATASVPDFSRDAQKNFIENRLKRTRSDQINYDFDYNKKETIKLWKQGDYNTPVFKGEVKFPKHLRKENLQIEDVNYKFGDFK